MPDNTEADYCRLQSSDVATRFLDAGSIEVVGNFVPRTPPQHVLFDFDGTLSLIREGWTVIMVDMMVEYLLQTDPPEPSEELRRQCSESVMELTGKQTIYQMIHLANEISSRGSTPLDPLQYKAEYHRRLMEKIEARRAGLRNGTIQPEELLVPGSRELLTALQQRGAEIYLASGTDEVYVREEVALLQLDHFFGRHVHGAVDDYKSFSKAQVIHRILTENSVDGSTLLGFGDGYVEIQNVLEVGGIAVAVASDESHRSGKPDPWKRERLLGAGANVIVPDYACGMRLLDWLWNS